MHFTGLVEQHHPNKNCSKQVAAEIAAPLANCKKITMVSMGQGDIGVSKLTTEVLQVIERLPKMVEGVTGVDIVKVIPSLIATAAAAVKAAPYSILLWFISHV